LIKQKNIKNDSKMKTHKMLHNKRQSLVFLVILLLLGGAIFVYDRSQNHPADSAGEPTTQKSTPATTSTSASQDKQQTTSNPTPASSNLKGTVLAPFGTFVSNHQPNLSGSPAPNSMQSVCQTTPGAVCKISFNQVTTTKSLDPKVTDSNGIASWSWRLQDVGLTQGTWEIAATASSADQSQTTTDSIKLTVGP
jgi:hypothetical protein